MQSEKQRQSAKKYRETHREKRAAYQREYAKRPDAKERANARRRERWGSDEAWRAHRSELAKQKYQRTRDKILAELREKSRADPLFYRKKALRGYGLTEDSLLEMFASQENKCAICQAILEPYGGPKGTHIDHCHSTGKVRGLLCPQCNHGLGKFRDSPEALRRAADYLERSRK